MQIVLKQVFATRKSYVLGVGCMRSIDHPPETQKKRKNTQEEVKEEKENKRTCMKDRTIRQYLIPTNQPKDRETHTLEKIHNIQQQEEPPQNAQQDEEEKHESYGEYEEQEKEEDEEEE